MKEARAYSGIAAVGAAALLVAVGDERLGAFLSTGLFAGLEYGLFAAAAAFALFDYREQRDPALLLVGIGAGTLVAHEALVALVASLVTGPFAGRWRSVTGFAEVAGQLTVAGTLLILVVRREQRGRPPLRPSSVLLAVAGAVAALDVAVLVTRAEPVRTYGTSDLGPLGMLTTGALLSAGAIVAAFAAQRKERFSWAAGAGLALALSGLSLLLTGTAGSGTPLSPLHLLASATPGLAAVCLTVFTLASIRLETSHMRRATDHAQEVMDGRAEIASMVAHDVKGPVGTIKGLATTTLKSYDRLGDAERLEFVGLMEKEAGHLLALVNQIALALKVDAGTLGFDLRVQEVGPLVRHGTEQANTHDRAVQVDVPDGIVARVDAQWLPEAVRQAVENAAKFSPDGTTVSVSLRGAGHGGPVIIEVADEGPGIPAPHREEVFLKFTRWRPTGYEDRPGSGLGLFICRGIARQHGGEASVVGSASGGTICRIEFPREGKN